MITIITTSIVSIICMICMIASITIVLITCITTVLSLLVGSLSASLSNFGSLTSRGEGSGFRAYILWANNCTGFGGPFLLLRKHVRTTLGSPNSSSLCSKLVKVCCQDLVRPLDLSCVGAVDDWEVAILTVHVPFPDLALDL